MNWLREHQFALNAAWSRLRKTPGSFSFNVLVIAMALVLPLAGMTLLENLRPVSRELAVDPEMTVFLATDFPQDQAVALSAQLVNSAKSAGIDIKLEFISREKALATLKERAGLNDIVATLGNNPLPDAYVVRLAKPQDAKSAANIEKLAESFKRAPGVEAVQLDAAWVKRLAALFQLGAVVLWLLAATLAGVVLSVVFNTIRLQVINQSEEISVSRLLGATDAFVSRPFYYAGGLLGLAAGSLALAGVFAILALLSAPIRELATLYGSVFQLEPLNLTTSALLLVASLMLGVIGAMLSVRRALRESD
jgi:cell division transport system permease protein